MDRLVKGYNTDVETIDRVIEKHLDEKHLAAAKAIGETFDHFWPRVMDLQKQTNGNIPERIAVHDVKLFGKVVPGWYFPVVTKSEMNPERAAEQFSHLDDGLNGKLEMKLTDNYYADDMTNHSFTERRTENKLPLELSPTAMSIGFSRFTRDLNFRLPIRDSLRIALEPSIRK